jgi:hypothetical protein
LAFTDMQSRDFLRTGAKTPLLEYYTAAGVVCSLATNSQQLLECARHCFLAFDTPPDRVDFTLRFWVDDTDQESAPWPKPYVRGLDYLVFAGLGASSSFLADLQSKHVIGRFSATMADDAAHWRGIVFPLLLSIVAGSAGVIELHASCVAKGDDGLILMGPSRSGKSTLAMALAELGFRVLSDDRTFCRLKESRLLAYGVPKALKLRWEATSWFETLRHRKPVKLDSGESVFYCETTAQSLGSDNQVCVPRALVVLDRKRSPTFSASRMKSREIRSYIEADLLAETAAAAEGQEYTIEHLISLPCWHLRYRDNPHIVARRILQHLADSSKLTNFLVNTEEHNHRNSLQF